MQAVVEEAATEMTRVGDVLGSAESVSATVDSASRLAYRAFAFWIPTIPGAAAYFQLRRTIHRWRHGEASRPSEAPAAA